MDEERQHKLGLKETQDNPSESDLVEVKDSITPPVPDGGLIAWTQVLMGYLIMFNIWGYINSFGVFQTYYVTLLGRSPSDISWIGSMQISLLFLVSTFSGRATDMGYFHQSILLGSFLQVLSVFMTSLSSRYWQLFLAQGVTMGLGNGLLFCPVLVRSIPEKLVWEANKIPLFTNARY
ncbi:MAG: hypothetical protein Q9181_001885 [Wetmoreana brouardii]